MFHSLARPDGRHSLTTEQALRRLKALGFTCTDEPIRKTLNTLTSCLLGKRKIDDYYEKKHNWDLFTQMMLSAWIRLFEPENVHALYFAKRWAYTVEAAFQNGCFNREAYLSAYRLTMDSAAKGNRELDFCNFYLLALLPGLLSPQTESAFLDYILSNPDGVYYLYTNPLIHPPQTFASLATVRWLSAIEILSLYPLAKEKLAFAAHWLLENRLSDGGWDLGAKAKDGIYLPLADSWRKSENRVLDCTEWISGILDRLMA